MAEAKSERPILGTTLSREELEKFLPEGVPIWFSHGFSCTFASPLEFDAMQERLSLSLDRIPGATKVSPFNAPPPFRAIVVEMDKKQWTLSLKPVVDQAGRWSLEIAFRDHGRAWGSNWAIWWMLRRAILPIVDATDDKDGSFEGAQRVFPG